MDRKTEREEVKKAKERMFKNREAMKEKLTAIDEAAHFEYKTKSVKTQKIVFLPEPKQKWHYELVALIPKMGHEFDCPKEFVWFPYAKYEWLRIMQLDPEHKIITPTKRELFYGYCLMVERLRRCMLEWSGADYIRETQERMTRDYLASEIDRLSEAITKASLNLGLTKEMKSGCKGKEDVEEDERDNGSDLFD